MSAKSNHSSKKPHSKNHSGKKSKVHHQTPDADLNHIDSSDHDENDSELKASKAGARAQKPRESHESESVTDQQQTFAMGDDGDEKSAEDVKLEFPYSELVRAYAPKAMDVAEKVATDWKRDGSFMNLGIENMYANMAVSMGLKKAKELEKKLDEKGVLSAVRLGVEVIKQQVNKKK